MTTITGFRGERKDREMISRERIAEIRKRLTNRASKGDWQQADHVGEPRAIVAVSSPNRSLLALDNDGMAIFEHERDAAVAAHAPRDLEDALQRGDELERIVVDLLDGMARWAADEDKTIHQDAFDAYVAGCNAVGRDPPADDR
jgi:hypothetical protein